MLFNISAACFGLYKANPVELVLMISASVIFKPLSVANSIASSRYFQDFKQGLRFAEWLGLENEGLMKCYGFDGSDQYRYARIF